MEYFKYSQSQINSGIDPYCSKQQLYKLIALILSDLMFYHNNFQHLSQKPLLKICLTLYQISNQEYFYQLQQQNNFKMNRAPSSNTNEYNLASEENQGYQGIRNVRLQASGCLALDVLDQCENYEPDAEEPKTSCRLHQNHKAVYFLKGEPWQKFCKQCALNKALCGHQIEKQYSQQQFQRKITLSSLIQEIKTTITKAEEEEKYLGSLGEQINKRYQENLATPIKAIDQLLKQLNEIRQAIYSIYDTKVSKTSSQLYQKQSLLKNSSFVLKQQLQNIENGYIQMISDELYDSSQFDAQVESVKEALEKSRQGMYMQYQKKQIQRIPNQIVEKIMTKILQLKSKRTIFDTIAPPLNQVKKIETQQKVIAKNNLFSERKTFSGPEDFQVLSCRKKSIRNSVNTIDQNNPCTSSSHSQSHKKANLSLRGSSKKRPNIPQTGNTTEYKKIQYLKQSNSSVYNSVGHGAQIFH